MLGLEGMIFLHGKKKKRGEREREGFVNGRRRTSLGVYVKTMQRLRATGKDSRSGNVRYGKHGVQE